MSNTLSLSRSRWAIAALLVGFVAPIGAGAARAAPAAAALVTQPVWVQRPTAQDMRRYYPAAALKARASGTAVIECRVGRNGLLRLCEILEDDPEPYRFGETALYLSGHFRMAPVARDGQPSAGGRVVIPIRFMMPDRRLGEGGDLRERPSPPAL